MSLRMALLGLLVTKGPTNGYALTRTFADSLSHVWSAQHSQVYPELARLAETGLVTVEDEGPRGQKRYTVTDAGRKALRHWLTEVEPNRTVRNENALRAFLLPTLDQEDAVRLVRKEAEYYQRRTEEITRQRDMLRDPQSTGFGVHAAELGVRISSAIAEWAEWAVAQLEADRARGNGG
ncbi:PadR family transcriptional regulator [Streptomyces werraensis]|uniref:PadR family transcriptional regulator n=1 Tax=Streptomyces werraensis TaxID=68284 RepID=A0ABV3JN16_9ACTN